jgi:hypothetical protein
MTKAYRWGGGETALVLLIQVWEICEGQPD